jgi:hypothetical protein
MALPQKYWQQLQQYGPSLQEAFAQQLAKDLQVALEDLPQKDWLSWLSAFLGSRPQDLAVFLYRVDISEQQLLSRAPQSTEELAQLILEREAQKVIFKAQYAGKL